jgi:hypothetical protein
MNVGGDPTEEYFYDGMTDELPTPQRHLSQCPVYRGAEVHNPVVGFRVESS